MRFVAAILMSLIPAAPTMADGICADPVAWAEAGGATQVVFLSVQAIQPELRSDEGPQNPEPIEIEPDVLRLGSDGLAGLSTETLAVVGAAVCFRYRPEWLGLTIANTGQEPAEGRLVIETKDGLVDAYLPVIEGKGTARVLLRASQPISLLSPDAFRFISAK